MIPVNLLAFGNAYTDGAPRRGWFVASFVDPAFSIRCRLAKNQPLQNAKGDFELKLYRHHAGDRESKVFPYNKTATTVSMLVGDGRFELYFCIQEKWEHITLEKDGDYAIWAPGVGHRWIAAVASSVFTARCPAVDADDQLPTSADQIPDDLRRLWATMNFPV